MSDKPILGYWDIRGLAQPIRNLLKYAGVDYQEKLYPFGPGKTVQEHDSINQHWYEKKFTLGLNFPNLPYWVDEEVKLSQSTAILKYLARQHGLMAGDVVTLAKQEMIEYQLLDITNALVSVCYTSGDYQTLREDYLKTTLPKHLEALDEYLGDNKWLTHDISYVDFLGFELLDTIRIFSSDALDGWSRLNNFVSRFENLASIKRYHSSGDYKSWPIFSPYAKWGYHR